MTNSTTSLASSSTTSLPRRLALTGDRNECPTCRASFNSTHAFDKHRTGAHAGGQRRCLTEPEMLARGMAVNRDGFWVSEVRTSLPATAARPRAEVS